MFGRKKQSDRQIKIGDRLINFPKDIDPSFRIPKSLQDFANKEEGSTDKGIPHVVMAIESVHVWRFNSILVLMDLIAGINP